MFKGKIQFNRQEFSGSFGDIGTDLPLMVGMIQAINLNSGSVFILFGLMQILTGFIYGLPMPLQPLKLMAVMVIAQKIAPNILYGAGLAIAIIMLILTLTGTLNWLAKLIPLCVVRGIQFALGLSLANLALKNYIPSNGTSGYILAMLGCLIILTIPKFSRFPSGIILIIIGGFYALIFNLKLYLIFTNISFTLPQPHQPTLNDIFTGLIVLALPQLPLSISNSVIATAQTVKDFFPEQNISVKKIGLTYSFANLIMPFLSGIPVCHGCGGLVGHYTLGARTGGSVIIYGSLYLIIGLFFSQIFTEFILVFPQPILGVVLLFESLNLLLLIKDQVIVKRNLTIALLVAMIAFSIPQGYLIGLLIGITLYYFSNYITFFSEQT